MRHVAILGRQLIKSLDLVLVRGKARLDFERNPETLGGGDEGTLQGDIRSLDHSVSGILKEIIERLPDFFLLEPVGGSDELEDGFLYFVCLL